MKAFENIRLIVTFTFLFVIITGVSRMSQAEELPHSIAEQIWISGALSATKQIADLCYGVDAKSITLQTPGGLVDIYCYTDIPVSE